MKKIKFLIPLALFGLMLSSCDANELRKNYSQSDLDIDTPWVDYYLPATGVEFAEGEEFLQLNKGETHNYNYSLSPSGATSNSLVWSSDEQSVATVDNGLLTAVGAGEATIKVSSPEEMFDPVELSVVVNVPLEDFSVSVPDKFDWEVSQPLEVTYTPNDTTYRDLVFSIENPSEEDVVSVDNEGVIHTTRANGTATLRVHSDYLGAEKDKTYPIVVQNVPINSLAVDYEEGQEHTNYLEVDEAMKFKYVITPDNASDYVRYGVKFVSSDESVLTIDPATGVARGVNPGTANVSVVCKDTTSTPKEITVYQSSVTSLSEVHLDDEVLSNDETNPLTTRLHFNANYTNAAGSGTLNDKVPNRWTVSYSSDDEEIVTVDNTGLVEAKNPGTANVKVTVSDGEHTLEQEKEVSVYMVSKSVKINSSSSVLYTDTSLELTASITPTNVSDDTIAWSVEPAGVVTLEPNGKSVTVTSVEDELDEPAVVTITASNEAAAHGGVTGSFELTVKERAVNFEAGTMYLVGNRAFNTGTSASGHTSWYTADGSNPRAARYAYTFATECYDPDITNQYKGTLHLHEGDEFRFFVGSDYYVPLFESGIDDQGNPWTAYHIQHTDGAFITEKLSLKDATNAETNIVVNETGYYDFYAKRYAKADSNDWYQLYICETPAIEVEIANASMGLDDTFTIKPVNVIGEVSYNVTENTANAEFEDGVITATGDEGRVVVSVNDSREGTPVVVTVNIVDGASGVSKTIYVNGNGHANKDSAKLFARTWAESSSTILPRDNEFTLVTGQSIVYSVSIPVEHNMIVIVRESPLATHLVWEGEYFWGQTQDLNIPTDGKDMFVSTGYKTVGEGEEAKEFLSGVWDVFDPNTVYEEEKVFEKDRPYIIGSSDYSTGTSTIGTGWTVAQSYKVTETEDDPSYYTQFVADITFRENDEWRGLYGNGTSLVDGNQGWISNVQSTEGAFSGTDPEMTLLANSNIKVNKPGTYHICIKVLLNDGGWQIYVKSNEEPTPVEGPFVQYHRGEEWIKEDLVENPGNPNEYMGSLELNANEEFVFFVGEEDWRHYENKKAGSADEVVAGIVDPTNFMASVAGTYTFYVEKAEHGQVFIAYTAPVVPPVEPDLHTLYFTNNKGFSGDAYVYAFKGSVANAEFPGVAMTYVEKDQFNADVYSASIDYALYDTVIFSMVDGGTKIQTKDIAISEFGSEHDGAYYLDTADEQGHYDCGFYKFEHYEPTPEEPELTSITLSGTYKITFELNEEFTHEGLVVTAHYSQEKADEVVTSSATFSNPDMTTAGKKTITVSYSDTYGEASTTYEITVNGSEPVDPDEITIYFTNNWKWTAVNAYVFKGGTPKTAWPGEAMTKVGRNSDLDDIYSFTVDKSEFDTLIINNGLGGDANQTVDIDLTNVETNQAYYCSGRETPLDDTTKVTVGTWTFSADAIIDEADVMKIYVTNSQYWNNLKVYIFNNETKAEKAGWPGVELKYEYTNDQSQGVYSFEIYTVNYDAFIVNGSGGQTIDILLSYLTGGNNSVWIKDTKVGDKYEVGYWKKS